MLGEEHQCPFAADAAQRHNERNAGARHIDLHFAAQILLDLLPAFCRYHGQQHRLQRLQKLFPQLGEQSSENDVHRLSSVSCLYTFVQDIFIVYIFEAIPLIRRRKKLEQVP